VTQGVTPGCGANPSKPGDHAARASSIAELETALEQARGHDRTSVVVVDVRESDWTEGSLFWQVGVPEVSDLESVGAARAAHDAGVTAQRRGV
jgi:3D-(3,5/4)-trihydroxycyclohexane-1,2-dione acylhydrolase (decyclizing)